MKSKPLILSGFMTIVVSLALLLFVVYYYPTGSDNTWGGIGILLISLILGLVGLLIITIGSVVILREKHLEKVWVKRNRE
ncbi:hypothetical protein NSQ54_03525 [Alkalihalobacillus sp. FSL W8-0930]